LSILIIIGDVILMLTSNLVFFEAIDFAHITYKQNIILKIFMAAISLLYNMTLLIFV
jgi:hypothetical protein